MFSSWEWASAWWKHHADDRRPSVVLCRDAGGRLVAVLPLYPATAAPLRLLRFIGFGPADQLGPVCAPSDRASAAAALVDALARLQGWDLFVGEHLLAEEGWPQAIPGRVVKRTPSPVLRFAGGWESFLGSLSTNARQQVRRRERRLAGTHDVGFRLSRDLGTLEQDLTTLFALHRARWPDGSEFADQEPFHRDFARLAAANGWLRLWFLELDGVPVAAWYGFRFAGLEVYYQAGREPAWERASVGDVLLAHTIRSALEDGVEEYRFGRGDEPYKYRYATEDSGLRTVAVGRGLMGRTGLAMFPLVRTWRPRALTRWYHTRSASGVARRS